MTTTTDTADMRQALADLVEWSARMGGFDAPAWDRARAILDAVRDAEEQQPAGPVAHGMQPGKVYRAHVRGEPDCEIAGTFECVSAAAAVSWFYTDPTRPEGFDGTGVCYEHAGGSEVFWDSITTQKDPSGQVLFLTRDGREWTAADVEFVEIDQ